jgi:glycosyltransferase involved in cell wall biosynthesis
LALPDEYDLLIYAKNGHRPQLLEHLAEAFPRHIQIHYGQYKREQLYEAARRSRACAYLADDDHGPLALQEILLAGCPTVGVRTGAAFVAHGINGYLVERMPPGQQCVNTDQDRASLALYLEALQQTQSMDRRAVRADSAERFSSARIVDSVIAALEAARAVPVVR